MLSPEQRKRKAEYARKYRVTNREAINKKKNEYRAANLEKERERDRNNYARNRDRKSKSLHKSYMKHREKRNAESRKWYKDNPVKAREIRLKYDRKVNCPAPTRACPLQCEMCKKEQVGKALCLDHCHTTGIFRGWLCSSCNRGLGLLGDNIPVAIERLRKYQSIFEAEAWLAIPGDGLMK